MGVDAISNPSGSVMIKTNKLLWIFTHNVAQCALALVTTLG
jgi:hypothetical protein